MISLITSYFVQSPISGSDVSTLSTPSFTPSNGELLVVKATTWDTNTPAGTPSGGGQVYSRKTTAATGVSFTAYVTIFTATVSGSPGSMSITLSPPAGGCYHCMTVERWSGATVAGTPAAVTVHNGTGAPSTSVTTTGTNSIVTWANVDESSKDPAGRAYLSGATEDGLGDAHLGSNSVHYFAYQTAAAAGSQSVGMSLPVAQKWTIGGIEIQEAGASPSTSPGAFLSFF